MRLAIILTAAILLGAGCSQDCLKGEMKPVYHKAWVQLIPTGKTMVPVLHPAYTSTDFVCNEYAPE